MNPEKKGLIAWFVYNPVAANLLLLGIIVLGLVSLSSIRTELMPKPESQVLSITAAYPGGSPQEVEQGITLKIEDAIRNVPGIKKVTSRVSASRSSTSIEVQDGFEVDDVLDRLQIAVDNIHTFPKDVERVTVSKPLTTELAMQVQLYGKLDEEQAKLLAEEIKRDMLANTIIKSVYVWGTRPYEVGIEISNEQLKRYGLTMRDVANRIRSESVNLPSGSIEVGGSSLAIRAEGQAYHQKDFESIVLLTSEDGRVIRLGDIGEVNDGFVSWSSDSLFDGQYTVGMAIAAVGNQDSIAVANAVKAYIKEKQKTLPEGVYLEEWADITYYLDSRLKMMNTNLLFGALLVFLVLMLFMDLKVAFWVMAGLPVAYLGAFIVMPTPFIDVSINMVSLFGFILVLGIIVDDAIVVAESVSTEVEKNGFSKASVLTGTKNVALATSFGVFTTVVAFIPTLLLDGPYRLLPFSVGAVVCITLMISLMESKLILPSHLADMQSGVMGKIKSRWQQVFQQRNNERLQKFVQSTYKPFLAKALDHRYATLAVFFGLLLFTVSLVQTGIVRYQLLPDMPNDFLQVSIDMGSGSTEERTKEVMKLINDSAYEVEKEYNQEFATDLGLIKHLGSNSSSATSGKFFMELVKEEHRQINSFEIIERWRKKVGEIPDAVEIDFAGLKQSSSRSTSLMLVSSDKQQLGQAAELLKAHLQTFDDFFAVSSTIEQNRPEYTLRLKPKAYAIGLTLGEVSLQVREAFYGIEAQRFPRHNEEVKVMLRYPESGRKSIADLQDMNIRTQDGRFIPLRELAFIELNYAENKILRVNSQAAAIISANISHDSNNSGKIIKAVKTEYLPELFKQFPNVSYKAEGTALEIQKIEGDIKLYFALAILAVFVLLAVPLKSYFQPFIIMSAIPFGIVGAIIGHGLLGYPISLMSLFGIIALSGVVVNDSLLMVDYVNRALEKGEPLLQAAMEAGGKRFRAIILTTVTTFVGLLPMLMERSLQAESMVPMAVSLGAGIVFATTITLVLVPCLYLVLEDIKRLFSKKAAS